METHKLRFPFDRRKRGQVNTGKAQFLMERCLEKEDLKNFFQIGMEPEDEELLNLMMDEADLNKDGVISLKEFQLLMNTYVQNLKQD